MAFRAGCLLFVLTILSVFGCREPLTPNVDRNFAPETWITAAPQDTITTRNDQGLPVTPSVGTIAVRYHMYWAGSDPDGEVVGFFYAVVETVPTPPPGFTTVPQLPGPKPQDYRFTSKTDSVFLFSVSEFSPDRQHAFFIYAVDNQGKPDPTPARVIFNALDRFPPLPVLPLNGGATATGNVYEMDQNGMTTSRIETFFINDSLSFDNFFLPTTDTVPTGARLDFNWRGEPTIAGVNVAGYRYKLDEPSFIDTTGTSISYNTGNGIDNVLPGSKLFTLRALDEAGGAKEITRRFQMNFNPTTWFAGPDPAAFPYQVDANGDLYYEVTDWFNLPSLTGSYFSCDSLSVQPGARHPHKTFFEIYKNRIYVRSENDTVHMNSWVIFHNGGADKDSPYLLAVSPIEPVLQDTSACPDPARVVHVTGPTGSAVGFHSLYETYLAPAGPATRPSESPVYPVFDPASVFRSPTIANYAGMRRAGKVYAVFRSEDGDGYTDGRVQRPRDLADRVDAGMGSPEENDLRPLIMTFYVDKPPLFLANDGAFVPQPNQTFFTRTLDLNLLATDPDPFERTTAPPVPGGPSSSSLFRYAVTVIGKNARGADTTYAVPGNPNYLFTPRITVSLPSYIVSTQIDIRVQLCDCPVCESEPGTGRCITQTFRVNVPAPVARETVGSNVQPTGPGSPSAVRRSP